MVLNTIVHYDTQRESVKNIISTYRKNFKNFSSELKNRVEDNAEIKHFYHRISSEHMKISIIDKISSDKVLQKNHSDELVKFFKFYSDALSEEISFLKNNSDLENSINILHGNHDKLQIKLQEINNEFEKKYKKNSNHQIKFNNLVISLPEETDHEVNRINRFNLSSRNNF